MFNHSDALILYSMLRHLRPQKIIEVGSGFSSALMLDVTDIFFDRCMQFTLVEPYTERLTQLLRSGDQKNIELIEDIVQKVPVSTFQKLDAGDVLFIDSSHVSKVGSDVSYIEFEVLPASEPGVVIHFHDIFRPFEYPMQWIIDGKAWTEAYLIRAFLQYNRQFEIMLFNNYVARAFEAFLTERMPIFMKKPGGSLWLRKLGTGRSVDEAAGDQRPVASGSQR